MYTPFIVAPITSENSYNNDTECPDERDITIASISDPDTRSELVFARYVDKVGNDSWGDHVVIAAIANIFHVTFDVVHSRRGCTVSVTRPVNSQSTCEIYLGLLMQ